jgi:hypothetical protein
MLQQQLALRHITMTLLAALIDALYQFAAASRHAAS